ncbi:hypothetical protein Forpi1262_v016597 [Fusarium oxysporum f. sp. raphani]|uniref:Uncharacterized protein n=1 Tax=Fusarium oxysporum f. sp. raphani TaxID=96318 RepID=A0A8J5P4R4_FUSOX|nr:hypothetical protein Forpi1262_v016597 [Fusarium oxysporum f. sp. raphani]
MSTPTDENWQPKAIVFDLLTGLLNSWDLWDASTPSKTHEDGGPWRQRYLEITFGAGSYKPYEDLVRQAAAEVGLPHQRPKRSSRTGRASKRGRKSPLFSKL